jgi:hypothetical protein
MATLAALTRRAVLLAKKSEFATLLKRAFDGEEFWIARNQWLSITLCGKMS